MASESNIDISILGFVDYGFDENRLLYHKMVASLIIVIRGKCCYSYARILVWHKYDSFIYTEEIIKHIERHASNF